MSSPLSPIPYADHQTPSPSRPDIVCLRDSAGVTFIGRSHPLSSAIFKIAGDLFGSLNMIWLSSYYFFGTPQPTAINRFFYHPYVRPIFVLAMLCAIVQPLHFAVRTARVAFTPERLRADAAGLLVVESAIFGLRRHSADNVSLRLKRYPSLLTENLAALVVSRARPRFLPRRSTLFSGYPRASLDELLATVNQMLRPVTDPSSKVTP